MIKTVDLSFGKSKCPMGPWEVIYRLPMAMGLWRVISHMIKAVDTSVGENRCPMGGHPQEVDPTLIKAVHLGPVSTGR